MSGRFRHFAAIDWSGAAGERHLGLVIGMCEARGGPPRIVRPGHRWSRPEVLQWLAVEMPPDTLVGLDLGLSLPFVDCGAYFPGWDRSPPDAKSLWALVDEICDGDNHLAAASFVDHPVASRYFRRHGGREGPLFHLGEAQDRRGRMRCTELSQAMQLRCNPVSNFNLVGAAQVGKASLTGMRLLHRLQGNLPIWPMDPLPQRGSVLVEIYTAIPAIAAGRRAGRAKIRSFEDLDGALAALGSPGLAGSGPLDDHRADALLTCAWLRGVAEDSSLWAPVGLTPALATTEGWTFGVP